MRPDLSCLEVAIGHSFRNRELLERALTHSSHVHEKGTGAVPALADNEQLEFLGDSILGFLISEALIERLPGYSEGRLSKLKSHIVSAAHLYGVADRLQLGQYLQLGRGEEMSGGRSKRTLLVDALEALLAALYLDAGIDRAREFVKRHVAGDPAVDSARSEDDLPAELTDFKSALQELARARNLPLPRYVIVKEKGPEHAKTFTVEVRVGKDWVAQAEGYSKKNAAQNAARLVFEQLSAGDPRTQISL
jgi:ribonuclease-3